MNLICQYEGFRVFLIVCIFLLYGNRAPQHFGYISLLYWYSIRCSIQCNRLGFGYVVFTRVISYVIFTIDAV